MLSASFKFNKKYISSLLLYHSAASRYYDTINLLPKRYLEYKETYASDLKILNQD